MLNLILNALTATVIALSNLMLYSAYDVTVSADNAITPISFRTEQYSGSELNGWTTPDNTCLYKGLVVPYKRTWEEVHTNYFGFTTVLPPEPTEHAGYAVLISHKKCEGKAPEPMFYVASVWMPVAKRTAYLFRNWNTRFDLVSSLREDQRPKWLEQVMGVIEEQAKTDPVAREFVAMLTQPAPVIVQGQAAAQAPVVPETQVQ